MVLTYGEKILTYNHKFVNEHMFINFRLAVRCGKWNCWL